MVNHKEFSIQSADGVTPLHIEVWEPEGELKGILQLSHGMVEHIKRYDGFARFMAENGYLVVGNDHIGHGRSVVSEDKLGYFCENNPSKVVVEDLNNIRKEIQKEHPDTPYFLLGHSMGSFIVRNYITKYAKGLKGTIIMGTGLMPNGKVKPGLALVKFLTMIKGPMHRSNFVNGMVIGNNNKAFAGSPDGEAWITKDKQKADEYYSDPLCTFIFTLNGFRALFESIIKNNMPERLAKIPRDMPVLFTSGADCCLGEYGKGVTKLSNIYKEMGMKDVSLKLYETDRHEILNETDRDVVYADILSWINSKNV